MPSFSKKQNRTAELRGGKKKTSYKEGLNRTADKATTLRNFDFNEEDS